jgi:hypothetical protein
MSYERDIASLTRENGNSLLAFSALGLHKDVLTCRLVGMALSLLLALIPQEYSRHSELHQMYLDRYYGHIHYHSPSDLARVRHISMHS